MLYYDPNENAWAFRYLPHVPNCTVLLPKSPLFCYGLRETHKGRRSNSLAMSMPTDTHTHTHTHRKKAPILWPRPLMREVKMWHLQSSRTEFWERWLSAGLSWVLYNQQSHYDIFDVSTGMAIGCNKALTVAISDQSSACQITDAEVPSAQMTFCSQPPVASFIPVSTSIWTFHLYKSQGYHLAKCCAYICADKQFRKLTKKWMFWSIWDT